jgi:hypothetical protein
MKRLSKREMVLEIYDREAMGEVTAREIAMINRGLVAEYGEGGLLPPAEIARILMNEDLPVRLEQIFNMTSVEEKYARIFEGVLNIDHLAAAEKSIRQIDALHHQFQRRHDRRGARAARELALRGKEQAISRSEDQSLAVNSRAEQAEIADWLTIWLQTPNLFEHWIELRKLSAEYQRLFGPVKDNIGEID